MKLFAAIVGTAALGLGLQANAAQYYATVTLTYGDVATDAAAPGTNDSSGPQISSFLCEAGYNNGGPPGPCFSGNFDGSGDKTWTASGGNKLALTPATTTFFGQRNLNESNDELNGNNGTSFYNPWDQHIDGIEDYTSVGQNNCIAANAFSPALVSAYACTNTTTFRSYSTPVKAIGPAAKATGVVIIDDVAGTMTSPPGNPLRIQKYYYRFADGAPFGGAAQDRISGTTSTLTVNWTGSFPAGLGAGAWTITGGTAALADTNFSCENAPGQTTLCGNTGTPDGSHRANGSHLSWVAIPVTDSTQGNFTVPGVVGSGSVDGSGNLTTSSGEFHRFVGATAIQGGGPCPNGVVYNPVQQTLTSSGGVNFLANVTCGIVTAGIWNIAGKVTGTVAASADTDGDGVPDNVDNCINVPNASQLDADGDGFGNACDADLNNSGTVTASDFAILRGVLGQASSASPTAAKADLNGSGTVTASDFAILRSRLGAAPGPSGLRPDCPGVCNGP